MTDAERLVTPFHHGSHRDLLREKPEVLAGQGVDAIIVPTSRPTPKLREAADLARSLDATLLTLHSGKLTSAEQARELLPGGLSLIAIDVPEPARLRLPAWRTSALLAGTVFARRTDLSAKRNLALMLGHLLGWSHVLFLDDDITEVNPDDVRRASGLLATYNAVGLRIGGWPDNSVVCHAYREAGGEQKSFVGGGAIAIDIRNSRSFFPDIYNDDWFFLLDDDKRLQPVAETGRVVQERHDPFRAPERARSEELGDVLAEGIYWLLDQGKSVLDADWEHWDRFLERRQWFIEGVITMVMHDASLDSGERGRRIEALQGALGRAKLITSALCETYLRDWREDRAQWQRHVASLPAGLPRDGALAYLARDGSPRLTVRFGRS